MEINVYHDSKLCKFLYGIWDILHILLMYVMSNNTENVDQLFDLIHQPFFPL
jgi:hypothetical protein